VNRDAQTLYLVFIHERAELVLESGNAYIEGHWLKLARILVTLLERQDRELALSLGREEKRFFPPMLGIDRNDYRDRCPWLVYR